MSHLSNAQSIIAALRSLRDERDSAVARAEAAETNAKTDDDNAALNLIDETAATIDGGTDPVTDDPLPTPTGGTGDLIDSV